MLALYTKNSFFDSPLSKGLTRYPKIPLGCLFQCKDLLNFTCHNIEFHNCHHTNVSVISVHFLLLWEDLRSYIGMLYWQFLATTVHCNCSIIQDIVNAKKKNIAVKNCNETKFGMKTTVCTCCLFKLCTLANLTKIY